MRIYPVILCGGAGTRLWPASQPSHPKQFIALIGGRSLFQDTVTRLQGLAGGRPPIIVASQRHAAEIERQLTAIGVMGVVITEPEGRDSAPAIAGAAAWIAAQDPHGIAVVVASDHHIPDAVAFRASVEVAAVAAAQGRIVTFGVKPTGPATAYGYIQPAQALDDAPGVFALGRFIEKPDAETARGCVEAGYLWNSGNFVSAAQTLLDELARHAPEVAAAATLAIAGARVSGAIVALGEAFRAAPKISIDYAVMEKTSRAAVLPVCFAWSDVGAWDAVWAASVRDDKGNAASGDVMLVDSRDSLVRAAGGPLVVGVGLRQIGVIAEGDSILVCDLNASQGVKAAVDRLKALGRIELGLAPALSAEDRLKALRMRFERWLFASALPLWWSLGADHTRGGFHEVLDAEAKAPAKPRRARVQARQAFVYALAGAVGWTGPWAQAAGHGLCFLNERYRRSDGLYRTLLNPDGTPADDTAMVYDQAFVMLAMAQASAAPGSSYETQALATLEALKAAQGHEAGGFRESAGGAFQADPQMHLLEAALAWEEAGGGPAWSVLADAQAELGLRHLIDPANGAVKENFMADWSPAPGRDGGLVEPGHQFEWAWLLERWGRMRSRADARVTARSLFAIGQRGVDPRTGAVVNDLLDDFSIDDASARLWPQTERLKAALILADGEPNETVRTGYLAAAAEAGEVLMRYFDGLVPGLWWDKLRPDGGFVAEASPASSFYHIACAFAELTARSPEP